MPSTLFKLQLLPPVLEPKINNSIGHSYMFSPSPPTATPHRGRSGVSPPAPHACHKVDECVKSLKAMGFGGDRHELSRLNVYAGAAAGDIEAAIEMIEEDREAARELENSSQISQAGSIGDFERDFEGENNPWGN